MGSCIRRGPGSRVGSDSRIDEMGREQRQDYKKAEKDLEVSTHESETTFDFGSPA